MDSPAPRMFFRTCADESGAMLRFKSSFIVVHDIVVITLTRTIKSVVTGQAPVTLEWRNTPRKKTLTKPKVVHAYIIADATNASARAI